MWWCASFRAPVSSALPSVGGRATRTSRASSKRSSGADDSATVSPHYSIPGREASKIEESLLGSVGLLHAGSHLGAWWIWKDDEELDPEWTIFSREDFLYVVRGTLMLELRDADDLVLEAGDSFVIPAGAAFCGYRWPRDSDELCLFVAVSAADVETTKAPIA